MMQHQNGADPADKRPQYDMGASEIERFQAAADERLFNAGHGLPLAERDYTVKSWGARRPQRAQLHCLKVECAERSLAPRCRSRSENTGRAETAKCGRRTKIFDAPDVLMLLAGNVVGEFFDGGVEEFYREYGQQSAYHAGIPGAARCDDQAERQTYDDENGFVAQSRVGSTAV